MWLKMFYVKIIINDVQAEKSCVNRSMCVKKKEEKQILSKCANWKQG